MNNEEYVKAICYLLKRIKNTKKLERIYNYVNNLFIGRGD